MLLNFAGGVFAPERRTIWEILKRIASLFLAILLILTLDFVLIRGLNEDPIWMPKTNDPDFTRYIHSQYGLDRPLYVQYGHYVLNMLSFDFFVSINLERGVEIREFIGNAILTTAALFAAILGLALFFGALYESVTSKASRHATRGFMRILALCLLSVPAVGFVLGLVHVNAWARYPLPVWQGDYGISDFPESIFQYAGRSIFPVIIGALACFGFVPYLVKSGLANAPPKTGVLERMKEATRRVLADTWTFRLFAAWSLTATFSVELIFNYRGLGMTTYQAVLLRDGPLLSATFYLIALMLLLLGFVLEIFRIAVSGRTTYEQKGDRLVDSSERGNEKQSFPRTSLANSIRAIWVDYRKSRSGIVALVFLLLFFAAGLLSPFISTVRDPMLTGNYEPNNPTNQWFNPHSPSLDQSPITGYVHPMGTDLWGRDIWSLVVYASRPALVTASIAFAVSMALGLAAGATGAVVGASRGLLIRGLSWVAEAVADAFVAIPLLVLLAAYAWWNWGAFKPWELALPGILAFYAWAWFYIARLARRDVGQDPLNRARLKTRVRAALPSITRRSLFLGKFAVLSVLLVVFSLEAFSLVYGTTPTWGSLIDSYFSWQVLQDHSRWWGLAFPLIAIGLFVTSVFVAIDTMERVVRTRQELREESSDRDSG